MTEQLNVQQMAERLCAADNILVLCHKNPDGDTIGCGSALCHALKALGKTAAVLCSDAVPSRYSFTAPVPFRGEFEPKTVVAVDVASVQLFGENNGVPQYTRHVDLCIDHHTGNSGYADFTLLDGNAAAAAELLYEVINEMGVEITPLIANCLYTGLATDTGCFRFSSTTANTHLVAAKLILAGAPSSTGASSSSAPPKACIISLLMFSRSSGVIPIRFIMSSTWGRPSWAAHLRHRPSLTISFFSFIREMNTTATFFLHLEQRVGCMVFLRYLLSKKAYPL